MKISGLDVHEQRIRNMVWQQVPDFCNQREHGGRQRRLAVRWFATLVGDFIIEKNRVPRCKKQSKQANKQTNARHTPLHQFTYLGTAPAQPLSHAERPLAGGALLRAVARPAAPAMFPACKFI